MSVPLADLTKELVIQSGIDAVALGALYAVFALGLALVYSIMRLVNFAYGELIMIGGYALALITGVPLVVLAIITVAIVAIAAVGMERAAFRPVRGADPATLLITSFALSFLLQNLARVAFTGLPRSVDLSATLVRPVRLGDVIIPKINVLSIVVCIVLLGSLGIFLRRTSLGVQMRAAAEDFATARLMGVRANTVIAIAFAVSGLLAGAAAFLLVAQSGTVFPTMGVNAIVVAFIATVLGGMGSLRGAVAGGFVLGALTVTLQVALPLDLRPFRDAFVFLIVLCVLVLRPEGLIVERSTVSRV